MFDSVSNFLITKLANTFDFDPQMKEKVKKGRPLELGPLNLAKTQYKPYLGGHHKRSKENLIKMGPLDNMVFDIPPVEESHEPIELNSLDKQKIKIEKLL